MAKKPYLTLADIEPFGRFVLWRTGERGRVLSRVSSVNYEVLLWRPSGVFTGKLNVNCRVKRVVRVVACV